MAFTDGDERRARLRAARLYLVTPIRPGGRDLAAVLEPALRGGVDVVQIRDKEAVDGDVLAAAAVARELCDTAGALLILNDRPDLVAAVDADGVHVGQDDAAPAHARAVVGPERLVGVSTHDPAQIAAAHDAEVVDLIGVGPVHATPTKPGRPAVGLELVRHAAGHATLPWFAIGGIDLDTVGTVAGAGATRIAVVRALTLAADPEAAARGLRAALPVAVGPDVAVEPRRSRKRRPQRPPSPPMPPDATFAERAALRTEFRNEEVRKGLEPLAPGERPRSVTVAAGLALVLAAANLVVTLTGHELVFNSGGNARGASLATSAILAFTGAGMLLRRYWAVLVFEVVIGMQVIACSLALVVTTNIWIALVLVVVIGALGTLFWKLIRAMARLQMPRTGAAIDVE